MLRHLSSVPTAIATFFVTLVLNTTVGTFTNDKGYVGVGKPVTIDGKSFAILSVDNYSNDFLEGLSVEIPNSVPIAGLISDSPVAFVDTPEPHRGNSRTVKINQISPQLTTRVLIPIASTGTITPIRVANAKASGLTLRKDGELESPFRRVFIDALVAAALYAVALGILSHFLSALFKSSDDRVESLRKELNERNISIENFKKGLVNAEEKIDKVSTNLENRFAKQRLLLQARLFDYSKELEFWRNAFRTLAMTGRGDEKRADEAIAAVTNTLKTYSTNKANYDFESIRVMAGILAQDEKANGTGRVEAS